MDPRRARGGQPGPIARARRFVTGQRAGSAIWRTAALALLVIFATISVAACGSSSSKETRKNTFSVGSNPVVKVTVGNGDVDLVVGPAGEIAVTAELRDSENVEYEVSQTGDSITVDAKTKRDGSADVTVTAPATTRFEFSAGNGDVSVAGVQASGIVNSGNGSITLEKISGDVVGNTGNGDITLSDVAGSFILNDGNGKITLRDATGSFAANLGNGNIAFQGELTGASDKTLTAGNGSVTVELTGSPSVALDLETDDGDIEVGPPVTITQQAEGKLVGTIGTGDATLTVSVGRGNITVK